MLDNELRTMIDEVKDGRMDRRGFVQRMLAFGLTAPMATQILAIGGVAMAQGPSALQADQARRRRALKLLWWQGPTLLNPHFATGTKDQDGSRLFYEPLACWDSSGNLLSDSGGGNSVDSERRSRRRRQVGYLEAQARRQMA